MKFIIRRYLVYHMKYRLKKKAEIVVKTEEEERKNKMKEYEILKTKKRFN